ELLPRTDLRWKKIKPQAGSGQASGRRAECGGNDGVWWRTTCKFIRRVSFDRLDPESHRLDARRNFVHEALSDFAASENLQRPHLIAELGRQLADGNAELPGEQIGVNLFLCAFRFDGSIQ